MSKPEKTIFKIALLFGLEMKINRDRFSGILRYAATKPNWEIRTSAASDISDIVNNAKIDRKAVWIPDGIIMVGNDNIYSRYNAFCQSLAHSHIPLVVIDGDSVRPDGMVLTDDAAIGHAAAEYFIKKGFHQFAAIGSRRKSDRRQSNLRLDAFKGRLAKDGFECRLIDMLHRESGRLLSIPRTAALLNDLPQPCAVFAYSDEVARYALDSCRYADIDVPERISILGVDDQTEITENTRPSLSSILPDYESSGHRAAEMLDAILSKTPTPSHAYISRIINIVERASTQDIRGGGRIVRIASEYIRLHLSEPLQTKNIAAALNMSPRLIELRFRETLDCSVHDKITSLRIEKAKNLIARGDVTFAQIAYACGYSSPDGLKLAFRKHLGMTMGEWRKHQTSLPPALRSGM